MNKTAKLSLFSLMFVVGISILIIVPNAKSGDITPINLDSFNSVRTLPNIYYPLTPFEVKITLNFNKGSCGGAYIENIPKGWIPTEIKGEGKGFYNDKTNTITFAPIDASGCGGKDTYDLTYVLTPPKDAIGTQLITGEFSVDGSSIKTGDKISSSNELTNVKSYNPQTETITITNANIDIVPVTVITAKLVTPRINHVSAGKDVKVAEFNFSVFYEYPDLFKGIVLYDLNNKNATIDRPMYWKYADVEKRIVNDYEKVCFSTIYGNIPVAREECNDILNGTKIIDVEVWKLLDMNNITAKNYRIGLFTDVLPNEKVEFVPNIASKEISEWAVWTSSLSNGLMVYYNFTDYNNSINSAVYSLVPSTGTPTLVNGKSGTALNCSAGSLKQTASYTQFNFANYSDFTISFWQLAYGLGGEKYILSKDDASAGNWYIGYETVLLPRTWGMASTNPRWASSTLNGTWNLYTVTCNATACIHYTNDIRGSQGTRINMKNNSATIFNICDYPTYPARFNGLIDELAIWNRTVSDSEVSTIFQGATYPEPSSGGDSVVPIVNLIAPDNATLTYNSTISFNATFSDNSGLQNATFYLWNSTSLVNTTFNSLTNNVSGLNITYILPRADNYTWNFLLFDNSSNKAWNNTNFTINYVIYGVYPSFTNEIINPINNTRYINKNNYTFSIMVSNENTTVGIEFNNVNYTMTNSSISFSCYQETANISTECGGLNTGQYGIPNGYSNTIDGDYSTYTDFTPGDIIYVNYTIPNDTINVTWQVKKAFSEITTNYSLVTNYSNNNKLLLRLKYESFNCPGTCNYGLYGYYYNNDSLSWVNLFGTSDNNFPLYEEAVFFQSSKEVYNITLSDLKVGVHPYYYWSYGNGSNVLFNRTINKKYTISKGLGNISLFLNNQSNNLSLAYNSSLIVKANSTLVGQISIYRNSTNATSENNISIFLGVGFYNYTANYSGNENYTSEIVTYYVNITPITPINGMSLSGTTPITYGTNSSYTASDTNIADGNCVYYLTPSNFIFKAGTQTFNYSTNGCQNYTYGSISSILTINKLNSTSNLTIFPSTPIIWNTSSNFTCFNNILMYNFTSQLFVNSINKTTENSLNLSRSAGTYTLNCTTYGNENISNSEVISSYTINKASSQTLISFNPSSPQNDSVLLNVSCSKNIGIGIIDLFRNSINVTSEINNLVNLSVGTYNYNCSLPSSENYSSSENISIYSVVSTAVTPPSSGGGGGGGGVEVLESKVNTTEIIGNKTTIISKLNNLRQSDPTLAWIIGLGSLVLLLALIIGFSNIDLKKQR